MITVERLRSIPLLAKLDAKELEQLGAACREQRVPRSSYIVYADDPGPSLMFLVDGEAKATLVSDHGKEIILAYLEQGDFFGELALLTGEDRSANVVAVTDCLVYILPATEFHKHVEQNSGLALAMLRELALRLRAATSKIGDLALYDVYQRVAKTLQSMAEEESGVGAETLVITKRPTHQELAALVGTSREMVTRALKALEEDGFLMNDGRRIEIRRPVK